MKHVPIATILALFAIPVPGFAQQQPSAQALSSEQSSCTPDPLLDVHHHTQSENGRLSLTVIYYRDYTYKMHFIGGATPQGHNSRAMMMDDNIIRGTWTIVDCRKFCWTPSSGSNAGKQLCKSNGHYIGQTPIPGWTSIPQMKAAAVASAQQVAQASPQPRTCTEAYQIARPLCGTGGRLQPVQCDGQHAAFYNTCLQTGDYKAAIVQWYGLEKR